MKYQEIDIDTYCDLLRDRYNECGSWHSDAADSLFENLLDIISECGVPRENASPMYIVDNYLVNGEFVSREQFENDPEYYHGSYQSWEDVCDNAFIYNDNYACLQF